MQVSCTVHRLYYLLVYVWLPMQELVGGLLVSGASHRGLLEEQRVQLTD